MCKLRVSVRGWPFFILFISEKIFSRRAIALRLIFTGGVILENEGPGSTSEPPAAKKPERKLLIFTSYTQAKERYSSPILHWRDYDISVSNIFGYKCSAGFRVTIHIFSKKMLQFSKCSWNYVSFYFNNQVEGRDFNFYKSCPLWL